jgi:hypothetical protein
MISFTKPNILFVFLAVSIYGTAYYSGVFFVFRLDKGNNIETKSSVQEPLGIFQLIDQIETAVDKLLERQVPVHFAYKGGDYGNCFGSTKLLT